MSSRAGASGQHELPGPIPSTLSTYLCVDFVNSEFAEHRSGAAMFDRLAMPAWRRWFLARCGLRPRSSLDAHTRSEAVRLRRLLRDLMLQRRPPNGPEVAVLNHFLARAALGRRIVRDRRGIALKAGWRPEGWAAAFAAVVVSYVDLTSRGRPGRIRVCANPNCTYMFVDDSRNGRRRWCDAAVCGNLIHVRSFRRRTAGARRLLGRDQLRHHSVSTSTSSDG